MNKAREFDASVLGELKALLGERVSTSAAVREHHGKDESYFPYALPDAVVFPHSTEEVRDVVDICRRHRVPMIPYGVGTSLEGHILAINGGVSLDLSQMNKVLAVHEEDLDAVVQAGVTRKQLNEYIKPTGLFFPVDPGADATIGGMAATRASGTNAVRYGTMRENVLSLKVVLADGRIIQTSPRAKKSAAGYDLTRLFVGSGGTLGIITEVPLRLYPAPEALPPAACAFDTVDGATSTAVASSQTDIPGSRAVSTDVCVPISRLAECVHETMEDVKNYIAPVPLLGHIGDGNFHLMLLVDPAKPEETETAKQFNQRLVERALRMEGTCTGEHGVGMGKMGSMRMELGEDVIDLMRDIKKVFDADNLMNPGKVIPAPS